MIGGARFPGGIDIESFSSRIGKLQALYAAIGADQKTGPGFSAAFAALVEQQRNNHETRGREPPPR